MRTAKFLAALLMCAQVSIVLAANSGSARSAGLGTSAAVDRLDRLWIAYTRSSGSGSEVVLQRSGDSGTSWQPPIQVTATAEPVSADGENRPKLAFGPNGELYVTWTSPTSAKFTADIRFARSLDGGKSWSAPSTVHHDRQQIAHRFDSLAVDGAGRVWVTWVDKRDLKLAQDAGRSYTGAAIYYAYSTDLGTTWQGDFKLADGSCECCRIALARDPQGRVGVLWRHVFAPDERDHAYALLAAGQPRTIRAQNAAPQIPMERVTFDRWRIDACPHHGPSLAYAANGTRHAVWFNQVAGQGRAFYGRLTAQGPDGIQTLPAGATHADIAVAGSDVAIAWKRFDGSATQVESWISHDGGRSFTAGPAVSTQGESDQPRLVSGARGISLVWRRSDAVVVRNLTTHVNAPSAAQVSSTPLSPEHGQSLRPFRRKSLATIERSYAGRPFWLVLWDLECSYCMKSLANLAAAQRADPTLTVVTIATDSITAEPQLRARLATFGVRGDAYAFAETPPEALQFAIDPAWLGEKPRAYRYDAAGKRRAVSGVIGQADVTGPR